MGLWGSNGCTLCQRARNQREDDQREGCGRIDPETLGHIQSARCALQARAAAPPLLAASSEGDNSSVTRVEGVDRGFPTLAGEQSIQSFWKETCRELYRRATLTDVQAREMTDEVLEDIMWEAARPWEERWETLKVDESRVEEQEVDDKDRQARRDPETSRDSAPCCNTRP